MAHSRPRITRKHAVGFPVAFAVIVAAAGSTMSTGWAGEGSPGAVSRYMLRIAEEDRRLVEVDAILATRASEILMYPDNYDASHLPKGWATFVRELEVQDSEGRPVDIVPSGLSRWRLPEGTPRPLHLSYQVLVHHDQGHWPVGWDEAAYAKRRCDCVFLTGMAVFIGARDLENVEIELDLPGPYRSRPAWTSVTPWERVPGEIDTYRASDFHELSEVGLVVGSMPVEVVRVGQAEIGVAVGRGFPDGVSLFARAVTDYMEAASGLFGKAPRGRFAVIANPDIFTGGGAFVRSVSMLFETEPTWSERYRWGHIVAHELVHLWNGHSLRFEESEEWFKEGVTDYLSRIVQARAGHLTAEQFFADIAEGYPWYRREIGRASLAEAGARKAELDTLVYRGGFYAGLELDLALRRHTAGHRGLPELVALLYGRLGAGGGLVSLGDITSGAASLGAGDLGGLVERLAESRDPIPVESLVADLGWMLEPAGEPDSWTALPLEPAPPGSARLRGCVLEGC